MAEKRELYGIIHAPDGKNFQLIKKGKIEKLWDYFNFDRDFRQHHIINKFAKSRLIDLNTNKVIAELPRKNPHEPIDIDEKLEEMFFKPESNPQWPSFKSAKAYQDYLRQGGTTPDVIQVADIIFTMDSYDLEGRMINYGNLKHQKMLTVETPSGRYKPTSRLADFSDAIVTVDDLSSYRTDIQYVE